LAVSVTRDLRDPARTVGVLLEHAYHPGRSGRNHLRILADGSGIPQSRVDEMLDLVGLADAADRRAGAYSLGMRQRLGLAAALLGDPPVLVLDEPGNGLDPQGIRDLRDLLRARAAAGGTVFVSSHLLSEVEHLADEVVVLDRGRLVTTGPLSDLQETGISVRTPSPGQLTQLLEQAGGTVKTMTERELLVRGLTIEQIGDRACAAGIALHELAPQVGSLEDLFLQWTGDTGRHEAAPAGDKKEKEVVH
jgi:ABC-2 type transport system ATP-binding protein